MSPAVGKKMTELLPQGLLTLSQPCVQQLAKDQQSTWKRSETKLARQSYPQTQHEHKGAVRPICFDKLVQTCNKDNAAMF